MDVNGLRASRFDANTLREADTIEISGALQHWTPRTRPDMHTLLATGQSFTPEILLPLQVRRSFTHPVNSVVVHCVGRSPQRVDFEPWMRPAVFRQRALEAAGFSSEGILKLPLLSPHFEGASPHAFVLLREELRHYPRWAIFDTRRLSGCQDLPFFLAPLPAAVNVGYIVQLVHERLPESGPISGVFYDHLLLTDEWTPAATVALATILPHGADILERPPAVHYTLDLLELNVGYQTAVHRFEAAGIARPPSQQLVTRHAASTTSTTWVASARLGERPIHADPVHEGPARRDPRDHLICLVASAQCRPGAFTFHRSIDLPELPTRALHYVAQHAFVSRYFFVSFSPVVYRTLARVPMLFAVVRDEHELTPYVWIDVLPQAPYPVFHPVAGPTTLGGLFASVGLPCPAPAFATVNGQRWFGEARTFCFGDVVQVRQCLEDLISFSLDSYRSRLVHASLLYRPVIGPEMRFRSRSIQDCPAQVYRRFTRQRLYDHFRGIFTVQARELILAPGSQLLFVGPDLPAVRFASGCEGEPVCEAAQRLYDSLFGRSHGSRRVASMSLRLQDAWLFAALPAMPETTTWAFEYNGGISFVFADRAGAHLRQHPLIDRSVLLPELTYGEVGIAHHTFDNRPRPVVQRRTLRAAFPADQQEGPPVAHGVSLLQQRVRLVSAGPLIDSSRVGTSHISSEPLSRDTLPPTLGRPLQSISAMVLGPESGRFHICFAVGADCQAVTAALRAADRPESAEMLAPLYPMPRDTLGFVLCSWDPCTVTCAVHGPDEDSYLAVRLPAEASGREACALLGDQLFFCGQPVAKVSAFFNGMVFARRPPAYGLVSSPSFELVDRLRGVATPCRARLLPSMPQVGTHPRLASATTIRVQSGSESASPDATRQHGHPAPPVQSEAKSASDLAELQRLVRKVRRPWLEFLTRDMSRIFRLGKRLRVGLQPFLPPAAALPTEVHIFTDGAFYCPDGAGWAIVVVARHTHAEGGFQDFFIGYAGGPLRPFQSGPGATQPGNFPAELVALTFAAVFAGTLPRALPVHFWTDCTAAISIANGTAAPGGEGLSFATRCRALCQTAECGRSWSWNWVPSHQGHLFNDLADVVAKRSAAQLLGPSCYPDEFLRLFRHPLCAWGWRVDPLDDALPALEALNAGSYEPVDLVPEAIVAALAPAPATEECNIRLSCAFLLLNAQTFRGKREAFCAQLKSFNVSVAAFLETRAHKDVQTPCGCFYRFESAAEAGEGGCALYFRTSGAGSLFSIPRSSPACTQARKCSLFLHLWPGSRTSSCVVMHPTPVSQSLLFGPGGKPFQPSRACRPSEAEPFYWSMPMLSLGPSPANRLARTPAL